MTKVLRNALYGAPLPGALFGMNGSTAGGSTSLTVSAGFCTDATRQITIRLASALTKTTAAWAAGNNQGGGDGSALPANGTVHWYAIANLSTGADDIIWSTNASAPALPSGYGYARRIFSWLTVSSQWSKIYQNGDEFLFDVPINVWTANVADNTPITIVCASPLGVSTTARLAFVAGGTGAVVGLFSSLLVSDQAPGFIQGNVSFFSSAGGYIDSDVSIMTDLNRGVRFRSNGAVNNAFYVASKGFNDTRGRFS